MLASNWRGGKEPSSDITASCIASVTCGEALVKNSRITSPGAFSVASSKSICAGVLRPSV